ncbi:hypothetical protein OHB12_12025 [Nocardia sp. NBC_01730]|uniref:hypothetical protein n=1 Tax=Nocardia sp. NBC_01730 TaxID=2975998 RepID=UPI002E0E42B6|nr:hypothetical protein OHB12_12025 [Nocardia sp. NBC_01730]
MRRNATDFDRPITAATVLRVQGGHAVGPAELLSPEQLLTAIAGHREHGSALIGWARELGDLHAVLIPGQVDPARRATDLDEAATRAEITQVIAQIDSWAVFHVPRNPIARTHTHSLGEVISHVAKTYADAWWTVLHITDEQLRHEAWFHLGQVREGYSDLIEDIRARRVQLPLGWRGIESTPTT